MKKRDNVAEPQQHSPSGVELHKDKDEETLVPNSNPNPIPNPNPNPNPDPNFDGFDGSNGFYEIEAIRRKRVRKGQLQYLIKWRGWPETANTWEPLDNLQSVPDLVDAFEDGLKSGKHRKRKRKHAVHHTLPKKRLQRSTTSYSLRHFPTDSHSPAHPHDLVSADQGQTNADPTILVEPEQVNVNGFANRDENDYDPKLSELKATTSNGVDANSAGNAHVDAQSNAHVDAQSNAHVDAQSSAHVDAQSSAHVDAQSNAHVDAQSNAHVDAQSNAHVDAQSNAHVNVQSNAHVHAQSNAHVDAQSNAHVDAQSNAHVDAQSNAHVDAQSKVDCVEPVQSGPCRGAKRRKSGLVKRFRQETHACEPVNAQNASGMPVGTAPGCTGLAGNLGNNTHIKMDKAKPILKIVKIIKPVGYVSSKTEDASVTFIALRSDGSEVLVDNKYLKTSYPLLVSCSHNIN